MRGWFAIQEVGVLGRKERGQLELFITGSLRQLIPDDHILARVDRVLDLSWLPDEVAGLYCADNGRPGIDPEVAVRLMLAGLLLGIVHNRKLMREAQVNLAIRWFIGYGLHEIAGSFEPDAHPPTAGRGALPAHLRTDGQGVHRRSDRQRRDCACGHFADPRQCQLGEPGDAPRRSYRSRQRR
jgi:hypothetical protein